jgi:hypothetical protein
MKQYSIAMGIIALALWCTPLHVSMAQEASSGGYMNARVKVGTPIDPPGMKLTPAAAASIRAEQKATVSTADQSMISVSARALLDTDARIVPVSERLKRYILTDDRFRTDPALDDMHKAFLSRIQAMIDRFSDIIARLNSRIETLKGKGVNTSEAERFMLEAQASLDEAYAHASQTTSIRASTLKMSFQEVRQSLMSAVSSLKASAGVETRANVSTEASN